MSHYQTGSLAILAFGIMLFFVSAPALRLAARGYTSSSLEHEGELVTWMTRILSLIVAMLGLVTFLNLHS